MNSKSQVMIIGLGLAGLAAARVLRDLDLDVVLTDENRVTGGQYLRRLPRELGTNNWPGKDALKKTGQDLIQALGSNKPGLRIQSRIQGIENNGTVWGQDDSGRVWEEQAEFIILATGAREKFLPFPGWTLPGVISTGAAQIMMKSCGMFPGFEPIVGGLGPLPLALAGEILAAGGQVKAFWDQTAFKTSMRAMFQMIRHPNKIMQGIDPVARLGLSKKTQILRGRKVVQAAGNGRIEQVTLARVDEQGRALTGTEQTFTTDCLAVGHGFVPNIELAVLAGCRMEYVADKGGWVVAVNNNLRTSLPHMYAAGEITGVAGARKSLLEGRLAGLSVASNLGALSEKHFQEQAVLLKKRISSETAFGQTLHTLCQTPAGFLEDLPDDLIICRCEDVTLGEIRRQIANGFTTLDALKKSTQSGMGPCQGRTCGPILADVLSTLSPNQPRDLKPFSVRGPIKPIHLASLAAFDEGRKAGE
jgi:thioredoxin reductase/bacterioferritin-associated ferredoxin